MQSVIINNQKVPLNSGFKQLNDLIQTVSSYNLNKNKILLSVNVDGKNIDLDHEINFFELKDNSEVSLIFHDSRQLLQNSIGSIPNYTSLILIKIDDSIQNIMNVDTSADGSSSFSELISLLNLFVELMTKIQSNIKLIYNHSKSREIHSLEIELLGIMKGILAAKERDDSITLCDLLKHELKENILQWKINSPNILKRQLGDSA
jgi:hypothetical protein